MLRKGRLAVMITALLLLIGCKGGSIAGISQEQIAIDWVDALKLNGISYIVCWNMVVTDPNKIGEEAGKIAFRMDGNVHDPNYVMKDGDAALLEKGTVVHAVKSYASDEIVAVQDPSAFKGYRLYVNEKKQQELLPTLEQIAKLQAAKDQQLIVTIKQDEQDQSQEKASPVELKDGSGTFFISLFQPREGQTGVYSPQPTSSNSKTYQFVIDTGTAIGYADRLYYDGSRYYWNHPEPMALPSALAYYFINERDVVFRAQDMAFTLPNHAVTVATGERIKQGGDDGNLTLLAADGSAERKLFSQQAIDDLWKKIQKENPGDGGEGKTILYMASRAMPVSNGQLIAFETNKDKILKKNDGSFNVHLINTDGTGEKLLADGSKYGGNIILLDSVGNRLIAEGGDRSLLDINVKTGTIRHFPIHAMLVALSIDGRYVLYRNMANESTVGTELWAFDLDTENKISLGQAPRDFVYNQGIK